LLLAYGKDIDEISVQVLSCDREVTTKRGNRIDLVINTDKYLIGIENKIYSGIANDLSDYAAFLNERKEDKELLLVLLSLFDNGKTTMLSEADFRNITYTEYFKYIELLMGRYLQHANNKYLFFLIDFISTIRNLEKGTQMNKELLSFLTDNIGDVEGFMSEIKKVQDEMRNKVKALADLIDAEDKTDIKQNLWRDLNQLADVLVYDIFLKTEDNRLAVDAVIRPSGWSIELFFRKQSKYDLEKILENNNIEIIEHRDGRMIHKVYSYSEELIVIADALRSLLDKLYRHLQSDLK